MNLKHFFTFAVCCAALLATAAERQIIRTKIQPGKKYSFLRIAKLPDDFNALPSEGAKASFKRDAQNLYISVNMVDADPVSESTADQTILQKTGDALQIFIKPAHDSRLWEVLADCNGKKSCFFHWGAGRMFYPGADAAPPVKIAAKSTKTATGWQCDITFPIAEVAKAQKFPADTVWTIMIVRFNYGKNLPTREISCFPQVVRNESDPVRFGVIMD